MFERVGEKLGRHEDDDQHDGQFDEKTGHARLRASKGLT
jgi:hypothetical protein